MQESAYRLRSTWWHIDWNMCERICESDASRIPAQWHRCPPENHSLYLLLCSIVSDSIIRNSVHIYLNSCTALMVMCQCMVIVRVCVCGFERVCSLAIQLSRFNRNRENELSKYCCFQCIVTEWIWYKCFMPFNGVAVKRKLTNILIVFIKSIVNRKKNQIKRKLTKDLLTRLLARIQFEWHKVNVTHKPYWIYKSNK